MAPKLNYIKWVDHSGYEGSKWKSDETLYELTPFIVESYGIVFKETEDYIVLVSHYSLEGQHGTGEMCILKNCIMQRNDMVIVSGKSKEV